VFRVECCNKRSHRIILGGFIRVLCNADPRLNTCNTSVTSLFVPQASVDYTWFSTTWVTGGLGSVTCPWSVQAQPGQQVTLTIVDFTLRSFLTSYTSPNASQCPLQLVINDTTPVTPVLAGAGNVSSQLSTSLYQITTVSLCANVTDKFSVLTSVFGYSISVYIQSIFNPNNASLRNNTPRFFIQYFG
jgi:hypothetical protein